jgi:hypothetical protein
MLLTEMSSKLEWKGVREQYLAFILLHFNICNAHFNTKFGSRIGRGGGGLPESAKGSLWENRT